jgi:alpha-D-ribose 1-methylphosphonate 5-triphosphate diphosphatase
MASLEPARAMGLEAETGSLAPGKAADLILIEVNNDVPKVRHSFVGGRWVHHSGALLPGRTASRPHHDNNAALNANNLR